MASCVLAIYAIAPQVALAAPHIAFVAPTGWTAARIPAPMRNGTTTVRAWKSPGGSESIYINIQPWSEGLAAFYYMLRGEIFQLNPGNNYFVTTERRCPDHSLQARGIYARFRHNGREETIFIDMAVVHGYAAWVEYHNYEPQLSSSEPGVFMHSLSTFCVR